MSTNPTRHIAAEISQYAINLGLVVEQLRNNPQPPSGTDRQLLAPPVIQLRYACDQLHDALHQQTARDPQ